MHTISGSWATVGIAGLVIWLFGGLLNAASYYSPPRPRRHYAEIITSALFVTGGILEAVMLIGIGVSLLVD
ncbi:MULTISPECIES: hypothetical protein [Agrobacterium]|uniref:hypothetical protein n=1 Tax=Agrobacterium TaxID=357 RepID=UPI000DD44B07|nr:hypothetical protein [Agrobacterium sp. SORGH_AS_0745]MDP9759446.1 hypothetical protein [Agrobacterium tumefaciens]MDQ1223250.1 hypothetical protein [Agrobacterium sp. SORGH_AS_0745]